MLLLTLVWSSTVHAVPGPRGSLVLDGRPVVFSAQPRDGGTALLMFDSPNEGKSWREVGRVAFDPKPRVDLGDGNAVRLRDGRIWAVFRHNHAPTDYAVEVAESRDKGKTWRFHSTVESSKPVGPGPSRGLWAPFLFVAGNGEPQCYYDDEALPFARGVPGHQWIAMRRWNGKRWLDPIVAAREPEGLSRDGMAAVVRSGRHGVLLAVEAVRKDEPHAGLLRLFRSADDGKTWGAPTVLYAPTDERFHAFSPSLVRLRDRLLLVFATNEDRAESPRSGTPAHRMMLDIKAMESRDEGRTWSAPTLVYGGTHRNYLPCAYPLGKDRVLATFLDFDRGSLGTVGQ